MGQIAVTPVDLVDSLYFFSRGTFGYTDQLYRANLNTGAVDDINLGDTRRLRVMASTIGDRAVIIAERNDSIILFNNQEGSTSPAVFAQIPNTTFGSVFTDIKSATNDSLAFFVVRDLSRTYQLWRSNGTPEGTFRIFSSSGFSRDIIELQTYKNRLYFSTRTGGGSDDKLYRTSENGDGVEIVGIATRNGRSVSPRNLQVYKDSLWFSGNADWSEQLFATDGDSVLIVREIRSQSGSPTSMTVYGGKLYWKYNGLVFGGDLRSNDFTNISSLPNGKRLAVAGYERMILSEDNRLFFRGSTADTGLEVWVLDSASLVPKLVEEITPGPVSSEPEVPSAFGTNVYFGAKGGCLGYELFKANRNGAENVLEANTNGADAYPDDMFAHNGLLYFSAETGLTGREIFVSDGTGGGTQLIRDVTPGRAGESILLSVGLGDYVYHTTRPYESISDMRRGFFRSDGTPEGTVDLYPQETLVEFSSPFVFKEKVFVIAEHTNQTCLLAYNPAEEKLDTIIRYFNFQYYLYPKIVPLDEDRFVVSAWSPEGILPFVSDGTSNGTRPLSDLLGYNVVTGAKYQNSIIFRKAVADGEVLYRTDGTFSGTYALSDVEQPFFRIFNIPAYESINDTLYFLATADGKVRLYGTDGSPGNYFEIPTEDGTSIDPGKRIEHINGTIYIAAWGSNQTPALYRTNANKTMLTKVSDVVVGPVGSLANAPRAMLEHNNYLFFNGYTEEFGEELYRSDGTEEGTIRVMDINPGRDFGRPLNFYSFEESLYFSASDGESGAELWRYNPGNEMFGTDPFAGAVCPALPTSTTGVDVEEKFRLIPNPAGETVVIDFAGEETVELSISSSDGREVLRVKPYRSGSFLSLSDLPNGLYIVSLQSSRTYEVRSQKLIVSH